MGDIPMPGSEDSGADIAIIGMSGRFPGARNIDEFWQNLCNGVESITRFSDGDLLQAGVDASLLSDPNYIKAGAILEDIDKFDGSFFGFTPGEAQILDPQQRLFIETAWNALESAGYNPEMYQRSIGLYAGAGLSTYFLNNLYPNADVIDTAGIMQVVLGNDKDSLTTRVAYLLNLTGPCYTVQTYCSTSLVATSIACSSLLNGECDMALAGGVLVSVPQKAGYYYQEGGIASPDAHCRAFDAKAKGSPLGNGVAVVVLKRLEDAIADGDTIHAVIKGSAINNDGSLKVGYTAPGVRGQAGVIVEALANAGVEAESISYIEAHGTGTPLGDAAELTALIKSFSESTNKKGFCAIGSAKTNVGHLDRAAGVTGLIKTTLALKHGLIPPSLNYEEPNPQIDLQDSPFYVNTRLMEWKTNGAPRRAGVSAFGIGGTNAHVVLEEPPILKFSSGSRKHKLLLLSARTETALETATANLHTYLQQHEETKLADVAYTLQVGRKAFEQRRMIVCSDREDALKALETPNTPQVLSSSQCIPERPVAFLFPGVGEQYVGMAQELYEQEPLFRDIVEQCCHLLQTTLGLDLRAALFPVQQANNHPARAQENGQHEVTSSAPLDLRALLGRTARSPAEAEAPLKQTALAQPAVFVIEYALAQLLLACGIRPQAMLGYSLGEYVAACLAGVFSLEDALTLVATRAQLIAALPPGAMLAVALSEEDLRPFLSEQVSLAIINGPNTCVLAGPPEALEAVERHLQAREVAVRWVETTHAFHSAMLEPLRASLEAVVGRMKRHAPHLPYLSNVTGTWITPEQATDPAYWAAHMCQTVRFAQGIAHLLEERERVLVEVGVGQSLSAFVRQHPACGSERFACVVPTLPSLYERQGEQEYLLKALGKLWLAGVQIDWSGFYAQERRQRVPLPTYPFERQRYWIETTNRTSRSQAVADTPEAVLTNLKREELSDWYYLPGWKHAAPFIQSSLLDDKQCWLLLLDECDVGRRLAQELERYQQDVVTVMPGKTFRQLGKGSYVVNPTARADYAALFKDLQAQGKQPQQVVHCWMVTPETAEPIRQEEMLNTTLERGFYSLLALTQAVEDVGLEACQLTVVSNNIQDVTGSERLCAEKATVLGPCRVIPLEYPTISCRSIDICLPEADSWQREDLIHQLIGELASTAGDPMVALRGSHRWVQTFESVHLTSQNAQAGRWREKGVYLITGGLGGIGLAMAEHLARTVQARLVLTSRSGLPPRSEWASILEGKGDTKKFHSQIRKMLVLEELGAKVLVLPADVSNEEQMSSVIQQAITTFGALHGVLHTAGVPGIGLMQLKTQELAASVLAPKVMGTLVLGRVLQNLSLDFLVLFSSITSTTGGGPGQVDYCAANAFLDAYARAYARRHLAHHGITIAIDWGEWKWNAWEAGLAGYDTEAQAFFRGYRQQFGIAFEEGAEALTRVLSCRLPQVIVSTQDFRAMVELSRSFTAVAMLQKTRQSHQKRAVHPRPNLVSSYIAPKSEAESKIAATWEELLGVSQVGVNDNFFELGGNSLIGIDLIARLRKEFAIETIPTYILYEAPTVSAMAQYLEQSTTTVAVEVRHERGEKRRESLKHRMREARGTR